MGACFGDLFMRYDDIGVFRLRPEEDDQGFSRQWFFEALSAP